VETTQRPGLTRRRLLGLVGAGAVAGAAGLTWRADDSGVYATGTGPAYAAWHRWQAATPEVRNLVRAGVLAANAHNTQPWRFRIGPDRIDLFADPSRNIGTIDPLRREMDLSLGCALENLVLAGTPNGFATTVGLLPDPARPDHIARVDLRPATTAGDTALFQAIPHRHTNRGPYRTDRPVTAQTRESLAGLVVAEPTRLIWPDRQAFGELTVRATEAIVADRQQADDDFVWYRTDWDHLQSTMDGITVDASGQPPFIRAAAKLMGTSRQQNHDGWLRSTRDVQLPTAAAFGILATTDALDRTQRLRTGRIWQRMHLWATGQGLAMQPLNQAVERAERERTAGLAPTFGDALAALLPAGWHAVMPFRIGYPTGEALPSPRRPAELVT
jgi:nitroreductase